MHFTKSDSRNPACHKAWLLTKAAQAESGRDGSLMPGTYMGELMDVLEPALSSVIGADIQIGGVI